MSGTNSRSRTAKTRGVNDRLLRMQSLAARHRDMDPQGLLTESVMRRHIEVCSCPYCGAGPFKSLASHTNRAHGIDRFELRRLAGMSTHDSIASPELSRRMRSIAHERDLPSIGRTAVAEGRTPRGVVHDDYSRRMIAEKTSKRMRALPASERSALGKRMSDAVTPEGRRRQSEAMKRHPVPEEQVRRFRELMASPEVEARRAAAREEKKKRKAS